MNRVVRTWVSRIAIIVSTAAGVAPAPAKAAGWVEYADEQQSGWSSKELSKARDFAATAGSAAVMIVDHGHVVAAWGAVDHPFKTSSIRKSLYDATIGATHYVRPFDVSSEIGPLNIDDIDPLSDQEKRTTFEDLFTARSGVYHPAAYETRSNARRRPKRGSAKPGAAWYYNNWDFNVLCVAFEKLSGEPIAQAFAERLAKPLGMEDFEAGHVFEYLEPRVSRHPAVTIRLSARDLARAGKLYLQNGRWNELQIVSEEWIRRSTMARTTFEKGHYRGEGVGYGRLWWIFPARPERDKPYEAHDRVAARGAGGQIMVLFPKLDVLVVHLADTDGGRGVRDARVDELLNMIIAARKEEPIADAALNPIRVEKLSDQPPTPLREDLTSLAESRRKALEGRFAASGGGGIRLYQFDSRLFAQPLGIPLGDVELFQASDGSLRSPLAGLVLEPITAANGSVDTMRVSFGGRTQTGKRVE